MNNYNGEAFPENMKQLTEKSYEIAEYFNKRLNQPNCPILQELYHLKNNRRFRNQALFKQHGYGIKSNYLKGLYVFGEQNNGIIEPVYIGISRNIYNRLKQHGWGKKDNEATLAYLIANKKYRNRIDVKGTNLTITIVSRVKRKHIDISADVPRAKEEVKQFKVAIYPIENDYELYFHEVAIAGILKTKWNIFRTH